MEILPLETDALVFSIYNDKCFRLFCVWLILSKYHRYTMYIYIFFFFLKMFYVNLDAQSYDACVCLHKTQPFYFDIILKSTCYKQRINILLYFRLREVAEKINRYGFVTPPAFNGLKVSIKRVVVGPTHIALLTEDNRVCRVAFTVLSDRLDLSKNEPNRK